jgi:hypothetical protein
MTMTITSSRIAHKVVWYLFYIVTALMVALAAARAQAPSIGGGNRTLSITTGTPGGEPVTVTNSGATLDYHRQKNIITKITVQTSCSGQKFGLAVVATSPSAGTAAPAVTLTNGMAAMDFIGAIPASSSTSSRSAGILYTASATFSQGTSAELGNDVHTVTFTQVAQ